MSVKLIKACRDLNMGMRPLVSYCKELGYNVSMDPNHRLTDDEYLHLVQAINSLQEKKEDVEPAVLIPKEQEEQASIIPDKAIIKSGIVYNPFEAKRRKEQISNLHSHPELSIENKKFSFIHADQWDFQKELQWVCDRKFQPSLNYTVQCEIETIGTEETPSKASITYGFLHYYRCTVPFVCLEEAVEDQMQITIVSFKKVNDTTNFNFDALLDEFLEAHPEFQRLYAGKVR